MFWERFEAECNGIGKKPNAVAKELHITSGTVTAWKYGRMPSATTIMRLCEYFGCNADYLTGKTKIRDPQGMEGERYAHANNTLSFSISESPHSSITLGEFTPQEIELIQIYRGLPLKEQLQLLQLAFDLQEKNKSERKS